MSTSIPRPDGAPARQPDDPETHLPASHWPLPELSVEQGPRTPTADDYVAAQASPEFAELRSRFRRFAFPMSFAFLAWYFLYVLLSVWAKDFMATKAIGNLNIGMVMGLLQFVTTFAITALYISHANRNLDPVAAQIRSSLEGDRP